jgi:asparagine synthase (glutamine-hydrolysing)
MCGINGIVTRNSQSNNRLPLMNDAIIHRGPDHEGVFNWSNGNYSVAMGMRRLAIIDINSGHQPMYSKDGSITIVFNGEIYNYKELKNILLLEGMEFYTSSDTEVILKLYEKYGTAAFGMLDGMFAISIYDKRKNVVLIARDYFGEKPIYYTHDSNQFIWASELKSIQHAFPAERSINKEALNLYFRLTYIPAPHTIYEGVFKLEPNKFIELDCEDFSFQISTIPLQSYDFEKIEKREAVRKVHDLVQESVISRAISDVPIGTFLSGGVDSSIVSLVLAKSQTQKIDTFSIGFEKKEFDETEKSNQIAKIIGSNHHEFIVRERDMAEDLDAVLLNFDEPFADSSAIPSYLVAKLTRKYVKVALTGDGGDEVFGGYNKYYMGKFNAKYTSLIPRKIHATILKGANNLLAQSEDRRGYRFKLKRLLSALNYDGDFYYNIISLAFQEEEIDALFANNFRCKSVFDYYQRLVGNKNSSLSYFRQIDKIISLEGDMLVKVDRSSMLASLESRAPFLNRKLWDFSHSLPEHYLINGLDKKHILKKAFEQYVPKGFFDKSKQGFGVPVGDWLKGSLRQELEDYTEKSFIENQGIFNFGYIRSLVDDHLKGTRDNTFRVWTFYCFQKWYKHNI